jgi:hypothetical protein
LRDELHVLVLDEDGLFSGTANTVLETFSFCSQGSDAKASDGTSNYYVDVVNNGSKYVRWMDHPSALSNAGSAISAASSIAGSTTAITDSLAGGTDDNAPTAAEIASGFDLLEDADTVDVGLLFAYPDANGAETIAEDLISIAAARKDCMAFVSPPIADSQGSAAPDTDVMAFANGLTSSSYASCDSGAADPCESAIGGDTNAMQSFLAAAIEIKSSAIVSAPLASGYANSNPTSTVSASSSKSNPDAISAAVGALSSVPPAKLSVIAVVEPAILDAADIAEPAFDNALG